MSTARASLHAAGGVKVKRRVAESRGSHPLKFVRTNHSRVPAVTSRVSVVEVVEPRKTAAAEKSA